MAAVPAQITDALTALQADSDALSSSKDEQATASNGLAAAQHQLDTANADVSAKSGQLSQDKDALIKLIQTTYTA